MLNKEEVKVRDKLVKAFLDKGIKIHEDFSKNTGSIYLKLDGGILGTIRIANHPNRGNKNYRYSIGSYIEENNVVQVDNKGKKISRYFYTVDSINKLIDNVCHFMEKKKEQLGNLYKESLDKEIDKLKKAKIETFLRRN